MLRLPYLWLLRFLCPQKGIHMQNLEAFYGPNAGYVLELYERYKQDPASVDEQSRAIFTTWSPDGVVPMPLSSTSERADASTRPLAPVQTQPDVAKILAA